jgi:hypothetical protein
VHVIEEVAAPAIPNLGLLHLVLRPEEDCAGENAAECFLQSAVTRAVVRHAPLDENLARAAEPDDRRSGTDGSSSQPEEDQPILSERNAVIGVADDLEKEAPVPSRVFQRFGRKAPDRQTAENERAGTERDVLIVFFAPAANDFDLLRPLDLRNWRGRIEETVVKEFPGTRARMFQHGRDSVSLLRWRSVAEKLRTDLVQLPDGLCREQNPGVAEIVVQKADPLSIAFAFPLP